MTLTDLIGAIGVFQILLAYLMNISGKLNNEDLTFILLNLMGSSMACFASILMAYVPFIVLEAVWAIASLISLIKHFRYKF